MFVGVIYFSIFLYLYIYIFIEALRAGAAVEIPLLLWLVLRNDGTSLLKMVLKVDLCLKQGWCFILGTLFRFKIVFKNEKCD